MDSPNQNRPAFSAAPAAPRWVAAALLLWLSLLVLGTGFASAVLLSSSEDYADSTAFQVVLCMNGGALGASLTALLAAGERVAHGWSQAADALARGERGFHARLAPLLAVQPILGAALGMVLLLVLSAGAVMLLRLPEGTTFDPMGLLLVSFVAGVFARTLLARVRDSVEALFGRLPAGSVEAARSPRTSPPQSATSPAEPPATVSPAATEAGAGPSPSLGASGSPADDAANSSSIDPAPPSPTGR
jgi:hypothetical protein